MKTASDLAKALAKRRVKTAEAAYEEGYSDGEAGDTKMGLLCDIGHDGVGSLSRWYWEGYQVGRKYFFASIRPQQGNV